MVPTNTMLASVVALAAAAAPALAQSYTGSLAFRDDHAPSTLPNVGPVWSPQTPANPHPFAILLGATDAEGFTNHGILSWTGSITITGGPATLQMGPGLRTPFNFNPGGNGALGVDNRTISDIEVARNPHVGHIPWPSGSPLPDPPILPQGLDEFFSAYRFFINLPDPLPQEDIIVTATGAMQVISGWTFTGGEEGGTASYAISSTLTDEPVTFTFVIPGIPAPGALSLLPLALIATTRRRRSRP